MAKKNQYEKVSVKRLKDYPYERGTKSPYFVEIDDGNDVYVEGFKNKSDAIAYAQKLDAKSRRVYLN